MLRQAKMATSVLALGLVFLTTGCTEFWTSTVSRGKSLDKNGVLLTTADLRTVTRVKRDDTVTCAEPSPDVAKIAAASMDASAAGSASSIGSVVSPEIALTLAMSRSEALAQLGQRLATTQLLRDGMYRACEAFANGAIDQSAYAAILSRYDDVMITMLLGEFAANSTTRIVPISLTGNSQAQGAAMVAVNAEAMNALNDQLNAEITKNGQLRQQVVDAGGTAAPTPAPAPDPAAEENADADASANEQENEASPATPAPTAPQAATESPELKKAKSDLAQSDARIAFLQEQIKAAKGLSTTSFASSGTQATQITVISEQQDRKEIAAALALMQQAYLDDLNLDALMIGCLTTNSKSDLAKACQEAMKDGKLLGEFAKGELLMSLMHATPSDPDLLQKKVADLEQMINRIDLGAGQPKKLTP